ncbi:MAG: polyprenyl synthetase family protein [Bacilli bacterium]|nr:polyprenyl synthetase family protein [Bacilli bacterium]
MKKIFEKCKQDIDNRLNEVLDQEIAKYRNNEFIVDALLELKRLSQNGKRVRGFLVKVGQLLKGVDDNSYLDLAVAMEIFQTAVLIHDDIIDNADTRRGMKTITSKYPDHLGLSKAICIGDLGFFLAYRLINETNLNAKTKGEVLKIFTDTIYNTVLGEITDVELPYKTKDYHKTIQEDIIYDIYVNKTAWYTIIGPLLMGGAAINITEKEKKQLIEIGINLGIAFQIKDDLLGMFSDQTTLGKTINDIKEGKQTIIYKYAIDKASEYDLKFINRYYGNPLIDEINTKKIINIFIKLGAKENAENLLKECINKSINLLKQSSFANQEKLIGFANYLLEREY